MYLNQITNPSFNVKKRLIESTFLPLLDDGDVLYMNAFAQSLQMLDSVYHGALRFITNCGFLTHHCTLYSKVSWTSLSARRLGHWYVFIYKAIIGKIPDYLSSLLILKDGLHNLRSMSFIQFVIPRVRTELGKKAFRFSAPSAWNSLQTEFKLQSLVSLNVFKSEMKALEYRSSECHSFNWWLLLFFSLPCTVESVFCCRFADLNGTNLVK